MTIQNRPDAVRRQPGNRVALAIADPSLYRPVFDYLGSEAGLEVIAGSDPGAVALPETPFDVCVADREGLAAVRSTIESRRAVADESFLPCLLVEPDTTGADQDGDSADDVTSTVNDVTPTVDEETASDPVVDEVIAGPVEGTELRRRVRTLLRVRQLSTEVAENEQRYGRLVEAAPAAICVLVEGRIVFLNDTGVELFGPAGDVQRRTPETTRENLEGLPFLDLVVGEDRNRVEDELEQLGRGERSDQLLETCLRDRGGTYRPVEITGASIDYYGEPAVQLVVRDVSEREERERRLELYSRAMDEASVGITIADVTAEDLPLIYVNDAFEAITGYPEGETLGRNCRFLQGPGTDPDTVAAIRAAIDAEEPITTVIRNYRKDGEPFWNELELAPVEDETGTVTHYFGFQRDVTARVRRERQLDALHGATRTLMAAPTRERVAEAVVETVEKVLDFPGVAVFLHDEDEHVLQPVASAERTRKLLGDIPPLPVDDSIAGEVFAAGESRLVEDVSDHDEVYDPETPVESELFVPLGDHGILVVGTTTDHAFDDADRRFLRTLGLNATAALDRAEREGQLRERKYALERYETIVDAAGEPIFTLDTGGHLVDVNEATESLLGAPAADLVGSPVERFLDERDAARVAERFAALSDGGPQFTLELDVHTERDDLRRCLVTVDALPAENGFEGAVGVLRDVTGRNRREQRLEVMDRVLRHNLRNEMNVVLGRAEALLRDADGETRAHLEEIVRAANALLAISEDARRFHEAFHGDDADVPQIEVDLVEVVERVAETYRERYPGAAITVDTPETALAWTHSAVRIPVEELVENAIVHSDRDSPQVTVTVKTTEQAVEVVVADDGPGIPPVERTTIDDGMESSLDHASGLGLWLVNWIVTSSGGDVSCEPNDPRGTRMRLLLPRVEQ